MGYAKPLYSATVSYRTPAGRRVLYGGVIAASNLDECSMCLNRSLVNEAKYGRRKIGNILEDFSAIQFGMQIPSKVSKNDQHQ